MPRIFTTIGAGSFTTVAADGDRAFFSVFVALHLLILMLQTHHLVGPYRASSRSGIVVTKTSKVCALLQTMPTLPVGIFYT